MGKNDINAFLGAGTVYRGHLVFQGSVRIDGEFEGDVESEGTLVVGREAKVTGTICVGTLVLSGSVNGTVRASEKIILSKEARMVGIIQAPSMAMEEGAVLKGKVNMDGDGDSSEDLPLKCESHE
ncbi:MAG: polymer-forming cytoskeletal protein [Deltaproteobacteria bacterium]|nr:polymer-forming cytoskeletal protein [Deltaproteobacteria bacterium]